MESRPTAPSPCSAASTSPSGCHRSPGPCAGHQPHACTVTGSRRCCSEGVRLGSASLKALLY